VQLAGPDRALTRSRAFQCSVLLGASAACFGGVGIPSRQPHVAVYRYINVKFGRRLNLGEPFSIPTLATRTDDSTWVLHRDAVVDPDSILIHVTSLGTVYAMEFIYRSDQSFAKLVATYTESLGPPSATSNRSAEWQDAQTRFRVWWTHGDTLGALRSRIDDR
jgi:hypothetical protein